MTAEDILQREVQVRTVDAALLGDRLPTYSRGTLRTNVDPLARQLSHCGGPCELGASQSHVPANTHPVQAHQFRFVSELGLRQVQVAIDTRPPEVNRAAET